MFKKWFSIFLVTILALTISSQSALAMAAAQPPQPGGLINELSQLTDGTVRIQYQSDDQHIQFLGTDLAHPITKLQETTSGIVAEEAAMAYLQTYGGLFGISNPQSEMLQVRSQADNGQTFVRYQQIYQGLPVLAGEMTVQLDANRNLLSISGEYAPAVSLDTRPVISADTATQTALELTAKEQAVNIDQLQASQPELAVYAPALLNDQDLTAPALVWQIEVTPLELLPIRELVLVNGSRGNVELAINQVDTFKDRDVYDMENNPTISYPGILKRSEGWAATSINEVDKAYAYTGNAYDFFFNHFGRDSIDGAGMPIITTVRYCEYGWCPVNNAWWNGSQLTFGDTYANADDVVIHEYSHGVTEHTANLFYYMQSGAINESMSDIFGEFEDLLNGSGTDTTAVRWKMGEDTAGGAIRDMANPPLYGDPDRVTSSNYYCSSGDNGGVHTNSGVSNKAASLMVDGGSFNGQTVTGLGIHMSAYIWYAALNNLLTSGSDFNDLGNALNQSCVGQIGTHLITTNSCAQVAKVVLATEMTSQPACFAEDALDSCPAGYTATTLYSNDFESGTAGWVFDKSVEDPSTNARWQWDSPYGPYAQQGDHFIYADDYPDDISDSTAAMTSSYAIPNGMDTYLYFAHAYDLEYGYDGGVVEYSVDGGTNWYNLSILGSRAENGYEDALYSTSNPLSNQEGFTGRSHGYISSRFKLSDLAGQDARFRWRMGLDSSVYRWGWWVDDVKLYSCNVPDHNIYLPFTVKADTSTSYYGTVTNNGAPASGQTVFMEYYDGGRYSIFDTATTDASGNYRFPSTPPVPYQGMYFYVYWYNPGNASYLDYWECNTVYNTTPVSNYNCSFNIHDIVLTGPADGASVTIPATFSWTMRSTTTDNYGLYIYDPVYHGSSYWSGNLGYVGSKYLTSTTTGLAPDYPYIWHIEVSTSAGNGVSYNERDVTFNLSYTGRLTKNGVALANQVVELRYYDGSTWSTYAERTTGADGRFTFGPLPPIYESGMYFYARWRNNYQSSLNDTLLWAWYCNYASPDYTAFGDYVCDMELMDIRQIHPTDGGVDYFPVNFTWTASNQTGEYYFMNLFDLSDSDPYAWFGSVSSPSYTLTSLPSGFSTYTAYGWYPEVDNYYGYGISYYYYPVIFGGTSLLSPYSSPGFKPIPFGDLEIPSWFDPETRTR